MAEFIIVMATAVAMASAAPTATPDPNAVPLNAPTVGFRTYADVVACEEAAAQLTVPAGRRLVCLPIIPLTEELATAY